jgi:hypothetical protein
MIPIVKTCNNRNSKTEGKEGWPLEPFAVNEHYLQRSLSLAKKVSNEFYLLAVTEMKILSNNKGDFGILKFVLPIIW